MKPVWGCESGLNPSTNSEVTEEDAARSRESKQLIRAGLQRFVDIWKGGCHRSQAYRSRMEAYVQYWVDIITELRSDDPPQAPTTLVYGFWPTTQWTTAHPPPPPAPDEVRRQRDLANATPEDERPDPWCGPLRRRPRPAFNPYRDALVGNFVLIRPNDTTIYPVWMGRVLAPAVRDARSPHHGKCQIRYWRPARGSRVMTDRERYRRCWDVKWEHDGSDDAVQWVDCTSILYGSSPKVNFAETSLRKIPRLDADNAKAILADSHAASEAAGDVRHAG
jgi:hypothetical protein